MEHSDVTKGGQWGISAAAFWWRQIQVGMLRNN